MAGAGATSRLKPPVVDTVFFTFIAGDEPATTAESRYLFCQLSQGHPIAFGVPARAKPPEIDEGKTGITDSRDQPVG